MNGFPLYWFVESNQDVLKYFQSKYDLPSDVDWGRFKYIGYVGEQNLVVSKNKGCYAAGSKYAFFEKNVNCTYLEKEEFLKFIQDKMNVWNVCFKGCALAADWQASVMQDKCNARLLDNGRYYFLRKSFNDSLLFFDYDYTKPDTLDVVDFDTFLELYYAERKRIDSALYCFRGCAESYEYSKNRGAEEIPLKLNDPTIFYFKNDEGFWESRISLPKNYSVVSFEQFLRLNNLDNKANTKFTLSDNNNSKTSKKQSQNGRSYNIPSKNFSISRGEEQKGVHFKSKESKTKLASRHLEYGGKALRS